MIGKQYFLPYKRGSFHDYLLFSPFLTTFGRYIKFPEFDISSNDFSSWNWENTKFLARKAFGKAKKCKKKQRKWIFNAKKIASKWGAFWVIDDRLLVRTEDSRNNNNNLLIHIYFARWKFWIGHKKVGGYVEQQQAETTNYLFM